MAWIILQTSGPRNLVVSVSVGILFVVTLAIFPALLLEFLFTQVFSRGLDHQAPFWIGMAGPYVWSLSR